MGLAAGLSLYALLGGCTGEGQPLQVASHVWPGYELMFLARERGWLDPARVELEPTTSATHSMALLRLGHVDAAALTLDETLRLAAEGVPLRVGLVFNISAGADMVLARPPIAASSDLVGARIGVEETALGALMLSELLAFAGLSREDLEVVPLTIDQQWSAWETEAVDALVTYEPVAGRVRADGAHLLFDSRRIPDTIFDVLAVRTPVASDQARHLRHLTASHFRALHHFRSNPVDAGYRMANRLGVTGDGAIDAFRGITLPDYHANLALLRPDDSRVVEAMDKLVPAMAVAGVPAEPPGGEPLVTTAWLAEAP